MSDASDDSRERPDTAIIWDGRHERAARGRTAAEGTWAPPPQRVDVTIYEDRYGRHLIEVRGNNLVLQRTVAWGEGRAPLHYSAELTRDMIKGVTQCP